jgi:hypothetical protein
MGPTSGTFTTKVEVGVPVSKIVCRDPTALSAQPSTMGQPYLCVAAISQQTPSKTPQCTTGTKCFLSTVMVVLTVETTTP